MGFGLNRDQIGGNPGFFGQFTQSGLAGAFALINAALRHLPGAVQAVKTLAGKHLSARVEQHDTGIGTIGQQGNLVWGHHPENGQPEGLACSFVIAWWTGPTAP